MSFYIGLKSKAQRSVKKAEKQLKDLIEVVRKDWKSAIETGKVTKENAAKCNDPKNLMKIEKQADKTYDVACKIKNYDADCKPLQFAADKQKLLVRLRCPQFF